MTKKEFIENCTRFTVYGYTDIGYYYEGFYIFQNEKNKALIFFNEQW